MVEGRCGHALRRVGVVRRGCVRREIRGRFTVSPRVPGADGRTLDPTHEGLEHRAELASSFPFTSGVRPIQGARRDRAGDRTRARATRPLAPSQTKGLGQCEILPSGLSPALPFMRGCQHASAAGSHGHLGTPPGRPARGGPQPGVLRGRVRRGVGYQIGLAVRRQHRLPGGRLGQLPDPGRVGLGRATPGASGHGAGRYPARPWPGHALDGLAAVRPAAAARAGAALAGRCRRPRREPLVRDHAGLLPPAFRQPHARPSSRPGTTHSRTSPSSPPDSSPRTPGRRGRT